MKGNYYSAEDIVRFARDKKVKETGAYSKGQNDGLNIIISALLSNCAIPPAKVAPVIHAKWIEDGEGTQTCSNCGEEHCWGEYRATYCDCCGALMDLMEG